MVAHTLACAAAMVACVGGPTALIGYATRNVQPDPHAPHPAVPHKEV